MNIEVSKKIWFVFCKLFLGEYWAMKFRSASVFQKTIIVSFCIAMIFVNISCQKSESALPTGLVPLSHLKINSVTPEYLLSSGNEKIEISGQNFEKGLEIWVGKDPYLNVKFVSSKKAKCITSPLSATGRADLTIKNKKFETVKKEPFFVVSVPANTDVYFVNSSEGDDSNLGSRPSQPWKSLKKVSENTFTSPTIVFLKRDEVWKKGLTINSSNFTIDAYGEGRAPLIDGSFPVSTWSNEGGGIFSKRVTLSSTQALGNISENGQMMTPFDWDSDPATSLSSAEFGSYTFNHQTGVIYIKIDGDPATNEYLISKVVFGVSAQGKSNIKISNLSITRFSLNGIDLPDCINCEVKNVTITKGGGAFLFKNPFGTPKYYYGGNGVQFGNSSKNGLLFDSNISEIFDTAISPQTYSDNQQASNFVFSGNTLDKNGLSGIEISILNPLGGASNCKIDDVLISDTQISNSGKGWSGNRYGEGRGIKILTSPGTGKISGVKLDNVLVADSAGEGVVAEGDSGDITISNSIIRGNHDYGVLLADPTSTTLKLTMITSLVYNNFGIAGVALNAPSALGIVLYHNTFYDNGQVNLAIFGQSGEAKIKNNVFFNSGLTSQLISLSQLTSADINHNCYNNSANMFNYNNALYSTVADFASGEGFELDGVGEGTVGFVNPGKEDFSLTAGSACRGLGEVGLGIKTDINGKSYLSPPSSGAFEF